jgi:hypothetical protein
MGHKSLRRRKRKLTLKGGSERKPLPLYCQCGNCPNPVQSGDMFCQFHKTNKCPIASPLTGFEPNFAPDEYNTDKAIQHSHNCFAYAMNVKDMEKIKSCQEKQNCHFHVPGKTKGHPDFRGQMGKTCGDVVARTMADVPRGYLIDFPTKCKSGFSKIGIVVDEENDLHYYRQDKNGLWSHKPGGRKVTNKDAAGSLIYAPHRASRYYPKEFEQDNTLNYDSFCSYMCVPRDNSIKIGGRRKTRKNRK